MITMGSIAWANLANEIGAPISAVMSEAMSRRRSAYASISRRTASTRSAGAAGGQSPSS